MKWMKANVFTPRPLVIVEDHMFHLQEILNVLAEGAPYWLAHTTLVCLDKPGPDSTEVVRGWLTKFPDLQVATRLESSGLSILDSFPGRLHNIPEMTFNHQISFCKMIAAMVRSGGFLIQDIQLSTLTFLPPEDWWASIYLANSIRGRFPKRPPSCWFMSNKTGFGISFGRELMEAGFDPREVIDKTKLATHFLPAIIDDLHTAFPLVLAICQNGMEPWTVPIHQADRPAVEEALDLVIWQVGPTAYELGGVQLTSQSGRSHKLKPQGHEALTWDRLFQDYFDCGSGIGIDDLGQRIAAEGAARAERTNAAARHIHALRKRLCDPQIVITQNHNYQLSRNLKIGKVTQVACR